MILHGLVKIASFHRAYSNLCRSFPIAYVGLVGRGQCVKKNSSLASKNKTLETF